MADKNISRKSGQSLFILFVKEVVEKNACLEELVNGSYEGNLKCYNEAVWEGIFDCSSTHTSKKKEKKIFYITDIIKKKFSSN